MVLSSSQYRTLPSAAASARRFMGAMDSLASVDVCARNPPGAKAKSSTSSTSLTKRQRHSADDGQPCTLHPSKRRRQASSVSSSLDFQVAVERAAQPNTCNKNSQQHQTPMKKSVSFATAEQTQRIVFDVSNEEKDNAWYNRSEYKEFQEDAQATALACRLGITNLIRPDDFCLRGLEANVSPKEGTVRRLKRLLLVNTILQEQFSQKMNNNGAVVNPETIRDLSTILSADASLDAVKRAVEDAQP